MASYILSPRYTAPLERVDELVEAHVAWLRANHATGRILGWGRKVPREGGVILAVCDDRAEAEALAASDPFVTGGVAETEVIAWAPSFLDESIAGLAG